MSLNGITLVLVSQYITDILRAEQRFPVFIGSCKNLTEFRVFEHDSITRCLFILHFFFFCFIIFFHDIKMLN